MNKLLLSTLVTLAIRVSAIVEEDATCAFNTLQQWYNASTGLWIPSTGWWNSANCLTVVANLAEIDDAIRIKAEYIFENTFVEAQKYNLQMHKEIGPLYLPHCHYGHQSSRIPTTNGFLNDYYDDEGWWALAWIAAYDVTGDTKYLRIAQSIFEDIANVWGTTPCRGGVWWDKARSYVNAIANELFLDVAAHLACRSGSRSWYYLSWAKKQWKWFEASGMINSQHLVNDGLTHDSCVNNNGTTWSYNQGVILGGLTELSRATNDTSYITMAKQIADAAIANLTDANRVLHDVCEPNCGADGSQFKGVFMRNLQILQQASPEVRYRSFLQRNADSILAADRANGYDLSLIWSGQCIDPKLRNGCLGCCVSDYVTRHAWRRNESQIVDKGVLSMLYSIETTATRILPNVAAGWRNAVIETFAEPPHFEDVHL